MAIFSLSAKSCLNSSGRFFCKLNKILPTCLKTLSEFLKNSFNITYRQHKAKLCLKFVERFLNSFSLQTSRNKVMAISRIDLEIFRFFDNVDISLMPYNTGAILMATQNCEHKNILVTIFECQTTISNHHHHYYYYNFIHLFCVSKEITFNYLNNVNQ
ncbi:hypothetical protein DERF_011205 [Dermatophagoides farinae]|uniref:Uncharacterized protein n=1 Tax=Dermatophagoides farinae TaxID=6954 RepID=A0A922HSG7_DERFA|nr:hypothetical protein DERF_011205 [Dermatophagoides farinae]